MLTDNILRVKNKVLNCKIVVYKEEMLMTFDVDYRVFTSSQATRVSRDRAIQRFHGHTGFDPFKPSYTLLDSSIVISIIGGNSGIVVKQKVVKVSSVFEEVDRNSKFSVIMADCPDLYMKRGERR